MPLFGNVLRLTFQFKQQFLGFNKPLQSGHMTTTFILFNPKMWRKKIPQSWYRPSGGGLMEQHISTLFAIYAFYSLTPVS